MRLKQSFSTNNQNGNTKRARIKMKQEVNDVTKKEISDSGKMYQLF